MAVSCEPHAATLILNQLKQEVAELKVACKLASQPNSSSAHSLRSLEREAQLARKQYDGLLEQRRKQAAELERIFAEWQQLEAGTAAQVQDSPAQRRAQQLQAQLADASAHLTEALYTQQQYTDVVQQLKQGHADFERQLEQLRSQLAGQQQLIAKSKAHLLQVQHARDAAKRDLAAAEQQLQAGRACRAGVLQQLSAQQTQLAASNSSRHDTNHFCSLGAAAAVRFLKDDDAAGQAGDVGGGADRLSAAQCLQRLFRVTGTSDPQGLLLHVKAHLKAAASLQEAAAAACIKLETGAAG
uniref:Uncharacterized protein n=1 Tax=Tetradesmus obliquus TaxID=3088 RepID=A0A383VSV8_TETOB|eukprot:jgi/Sobl393_1/3853/SZX67852.1